MSRKPDQTLSILRLVLSIEITSAPYNQFSLPLANEYNLTLCTYFKSESNISPPKTITLFEGDGSLTGFFRILKTALDEKEYDIIHTHTPHVGFLFLVATRRKFLHATIHTVHSSYPNYKPRNRLMLLPIFALFHRVVFCSYASFNSFPKFIRQLIGNRGHVVQNGVDINRVVRVIENIAPDLKQNHFTVVTVGRLIELKNTHALLTAFYQSGNSTSQLLFIGEGHLKTSLMTETNNLGLQKQVKFTGLIPREDVYKHLAGATNLFVSTSRIEGLPVATLEAMVCGCPVILSDIPPHREIAEGVDFIPLIQPDDITGFAQEMKRFQAMIPSERANIGERCRKLVEGRFSLVTMHKKYEEIYLQLIKVKHP